MTEIFRPIKPEAREDHDLWDLVFTHPVIAEISAKFSTYYGLTTTLDAGEDIFFNWVAKLQNSAYDKLAKTHKAPSEELPRNIDSDLDGTEWSMFYQYIAAQDEITPETVR
jgi:hypothetical protein